MIVAKLDDIMAQIAPTANMQRALDFLRQARSADLPDGRIEIAGDNVFALVQAYKTAPASDPVVFEAHRKYIDVQYMVAGHEVIAWAPVDRLAVTQPYDPASDAWLGALPASDATFVRLAVGELAVLYPTDGHAPRVAAGAPAAVRKIVVKVAAEA